MPPAVRVECPPDYEARLRDCFGADFEAEMQAMMAGATLDLRVNTAKASRDDVQAALRRDRVQTDPTPFAAAGLRARHKAYLAKTKAFMKGWIDIQDEGSQIVAQICEARPGMQAMDFCAGAGGKTVALADPYAWAPSRSTPTAAAWRIAALSARACDIVEVRRRTAPASPSARRRPSTSCWPTCLHRQRHPRRPTCAGAATRRWKTCQARPTFDRAAR
jgi:hypothetical protein